MVDTKQVRAQGQGPHNGPGRSGRTFSAGYIAPHPSIRKDAVDVDGFLQEHQVYTDEYLASVEPLHKVPSKWYEHVAWWWHVLARFMIGLLTGTLRMDESVTEFALAKRILFFTSVGTVGGLACALSNHVRAMLYNKPDNGWVHTALANGECVRAHGGMWATFSRPPLPARLFQLAFQIAMLGQMLAVYTLLPSVAMAYEAYRAEEAVFNYSQAISLLDRGRLKGWKGARAPGMALSFYALPDGASLRDALLRMRADEACIHHMSLVLADLPPLSKNPFITTSRAAAAK